MRCENICLSRRGCADSLGALASAGDLSEARGPEGGAGPGLIIALEWQIQRIREDRQPFVRARAASDDHGFPNCRAPGLQRFLSIPEGEGDAFQNGLSHRAAVGLVTEA